MRRTEELELALRVKGELNPGTFPPTVAQPHNFTTAQQVCKCCFKPEELQPVKSSPGLEWQSPAHLGRRDSSILRC